MCDFSRYQQDKQIREALARIAANRPLPNPKARSYCSDNGWTIEYKGKVIFGYCLDSAYKPIGAAKVVNLYASNVLDFPSIAAAKKYITENTGR